VRLPAEKHEQTLDVKNGKFKKSTAKYENFDTMCGLILHFHHVQQELKR